MWDTVTIGSHFKTGAGGTPKKSKKEFYDGGTIPWLLSGEVSQGEIKEAKNFITEEGLKSSAAKIFPENSVLVAMYGATAGQIGLLKFPAATNQAVCAIYPDKRALPKFIYYALLAKKNDLVSQAVGNAQPNISQHKIKNLNIPLPQIDEQKRIVTILDEAFAAIDQAIANTEKNIQNAKEVFESYLKSIFTQKNGQACKELGEIGKVSMCKRVLKKETSKTGEVPFYKIGTFGKEPNAFISQDMYNEYTAKYSFPKKGDVLISASGTIGRRVVYDGAPAYFQDSNIVWIDNDEISVLNDYLYHFYGVCDWQPSKGATISRLYNDDLRRIKISFPPIEEQRKLVQVIEEHYIQNEALKCKYQQKLLNLRELKQSLLQKAFSGELTKDMQEVA